MDEEVKMEIEGYDYEELIDKWGLRKKYKKLYKAISSLEELGAISEDDMLTMHDELGAKILTEYISNAVTHDNEGNTFIDPEVHEDMMKLLHSLINHAVCSQGDADMYQAIAALGMVPVTTFEFYRWFVHCLPLMWN